MNFATLPKPVPAKNRVRVELLRRVAENQKCLTIDFSAVPNTEDQHDQAVVLDRADEPVVTHTVFPKLPKL
jgi:hypothetical protein